MKSYSVGYQFFVEATSSYFWRKESVSKSITNPSEEHDLSKRVEKSLLQLLHSEFNYLWQSLQVAQKVSTRTSSEVKMDTVYVRKQAQVLDYYIMACNTMQKNVHILNLFLETKISVHEI